MCLNFANAGVDARGGEERLNETVRVTHLRGYRRGTYMCLYIYVYNYACICD